MEVLCTFETATAVRTYPKQVGEGKVCDVVFKSGSDKILASVFDDLATAVAGGQVKKGVLYKADIAINVREHEGKLFNSLRVSRLDVIFDVAAF